MWTRSDTNHLYGPGPGAAFVQRERNLLGKHEAQTVGALDEEQ